MPYKDVAQALKALRELEETNSAYQHAMEVLYLDAVTAAPKDTGEGRGKTMAILSEVSYGHLTNPENKQLYDYLEEHCGELDEKARREVQLGKRIYEQYSRIPADEYVSYQVLINDAQSAWEKAKNTDDFELFRPYLEKIVETNRRFAHYYNPTKSPYDALLNEYERGTDTKQLDEFFSELRRCIVPLIQKISDCEPVDDSFLYRPCPIEQQRRLSDYIMEVMGIDRSHCSIAETEHPFTTNFNNKDVRITTHYYENNFASSLYSVIHEGGHALYELNADDKYNYSFVAGGVSMGIHESQSRFYENIIGRSQEFIFAIYPKLRELFPQQLEDVTPDMLFRAVNKVTPSLIRLDADELTYCMHIMVRYELEKQLIDGSLAVKDLPAAWNKLYKEYLGLDVPSDSKGCLQDSHWSGGGIGYFPSYALGGAYGAQMLDCMEKDVPGLWDKVAGGDLSAVTGWLKEHIHKYASLYEPKELFERSCGAFQPKYYIDYLTKKYTKLYNLE